MTIQVIEIRIKVYILIRDILTLFVANYKKETSVELLKPNDAAKLAGVSYLTLKRWIYSGKIKATKTAGGHHRIARGEIERLIGASDRRESKRSKPVGLDAISGRNKLFGTITNVRYEGLLVGLD